MAGNDSSDQYLVADVIAAMVTMRGEGREEKVKAHSFLEGFQKSRDAWATTLSMLKSGADADVKLFAAITLRSKITYDLSEISQSELPALRNEIIQLLKHFSAGPKPIRIALCVCLAVLALQMTEWKDVIQTVVLALTGCVGGQACILDFLKILPEEAIDYRKIPMTGEELSQRVSELLASNTEYVLRLLSNLAQISPNAQNPQFFECITAWLRELHVGLIVKSPLLDVVMSGVELEVTTNEAAECLCTMLGDTNEIDNFDCMEILFPRVIGLVPKLKKAVQQEQTDTFKAITKITAKASQSWCLSMVKHTNQFRPLIEALLECVALDKNLDVIQHTFDFWYDLRMYLTVTKYEQSRIELLDVFVRLIGLLLERLRYPEPGSWDEQDLFEGDREQEDRFREFRHAIGDTLKDAAKVVGVSSCLKVIFDSVEKWMQTYGNPMGGSSVPHWQVLESSLFAMRAVGTEVPKDEDEILPRLMPLLVRVPDQTKLRFATNMVFARYTEWTAVHPQFLHPQFNYVIQSFNSGCKDVDRAAAMSLRYFCTDCCHLLSDQVGELQVFYDGILDKLPDSSRIDLTEGVATVVGTQPNAEIYSLLKMYCDPLVVRLMTMADVATTEREKLELADYIQLLTTFVSHVVPQAANGETNQAVVYWQEVFPILATVLDNFSSFSPILEKICRCWRSMIISYRTAMTPLLPEMANKLASGFQSTHEGGFLWVTAAILGEFSAHRGNIDPQITQNIYVFFEAQTVSFLQVMNDVLPADLPDVIEDFFRLVAEALLQYPHMFISSELLAPVFEAATYALVLEQHDAVRATMHYLRDLLTYGTDNPASTNTLSGTAGQQIKGIVLRLLETHGEILMQRIMTGLAFHFNNDLHSDATGLIASMMELMPAPSVIWLRRSVEMLPAGTVTQAELDKIMAKIQQQLQVGSSTAFRQIRSTIEEFAGQYRRRHVVPRDGLGPLEPARFQYAH